MGQLKVNILGHTETGEWKDMKIFDISYEHDQKQYHATYFGKNPLPVGEDTYEIFEDKDGKPRIKRPKKEWSGGGSKWTPKSEEQLLIEDRVKYPSFAVSYAKDCFVAGKIQEGMITKIADLFYKKMMELSCSPLDNTSPKLNPDTVKDLRKDTDEDLPF